MGGDSEDLTRTYEMPVAAPGAEIGPYTLVQQLGEGGMGVVYRAQQLKPIRRDVALKVIKPGMDSKQVIARFEGERQALAVMEHPNIAHVLDAGTTAAGLPYFAMEMVDGVSISRYCDSKRLRVNERIGLFIPVCEAVQHAHQKGVLHRDLKPSNILVAENEGKPVPKVIDFGLAKALGSVVSDATMLTNLGMVVGTLDYMSPEQADPARHDVDTRSDVYSLGAVLYELLTGSTPLGREQLDKSGYLEALRRIRDEDAPTPSARLRRSTTSEEIAACRQIDAARLPKLLHGELDWITMKALEKDRTRRYQTVNGLGRDLERYLAGEPVEAAPPFHRVPFAQVRAAAPVRFDHGGRVRGAAVCERGGEFLDGDQGQAGGGGGHPRAEHRHGRERFSTRGSVGSGERKKPSPAGHQAGPGFEGAHGARPGRRARGGQIPGTTGVRSVDPTDHRNHIQGPGSLSGGSAANRTGRRFALASAH
jgi:serine/threonine-protein kinase